MKVKLVILAVVLVGLMVSVVIIPIVPWLVEVLARTSRLGFWAPVAYGGLYIATCLLLIPASIPTLAAGFFFGVPLGSAISILGSTVGACAAFLVGRFLARDWILARETRSRRFNALDNAVSEHGLKIVVLSRLSPISPFIVLNYMFALTKVSCWKYALGTLVGAAPGMTLFVFFGAGLRSLEEVVAYARGESRPMLTHQVFFWASLLVTVLVTVFLARWARQALRNAMPPDEAPRDDGRLSP
jgi:uncharacterized membrane protein YdjX (TVP38/TMEM64 family)